MLIVIACIVFAALIFVGIWWFGKKSIYAKTNGNKPEKTG